MKDKGQHVKQLKRILEEKEIETEENLRKKLQISLGRYRNTFYS